MAEGSYGQVLGNRPVVEHKRKSFDLESREPKSNFPGGRKSL